MLNEFKLVSKPGEDGIHADGSFLQHSGILYNGNYGKDMVSIPRHDGRVMKKLTYSYL